MLVCIWVYMSVLLRIADGFIVRGSSAPLVVPLGASVVLPCSVDKPLLIEGLEVEWRRTDSETLVHLFEDGESRPETQQQDYYDRAHFFTEEIQHGNFSLLLNNVRHEDKGGYRCTVHSDQDSAETVIEIKDVERLIVSGSNHSISVYAGEDVTLSCSVDSHIPPEEIEQVSWKRADEDILVLLFQSNEIIPESSDERYRDRAEFFTDEIPKGNFSLRLKSVRTEDKGVYMCEVFAGGVSANTIAVLERTGFSTLHIMALILCITSSGSALLICCLIYCRSQYYKGLIVKHERDPFIPLRGSVVLPCFIDPQLLKKELKVEWRRTDSETLVHLFQDGESRPEAQHQDYYERAHFFTEEIQHGNFSLLLNNVRAEDKGGYRCTVYSEQESAETVVEIKDVGFSALHIMMLILCIAASGSALLLYCAIYCKSQNEDIVFRLQMSLVFCPNILMFFAFVLWGATEGFLNETVTCCALYFLRCLMLLWAAPYVNDFKGNIKTWILNWSYRTEFILFSAVIYLVLFKYVLGKGLNYGGAEGFVIIVIFVIMLLFCLFIIISLFGRISGTLSQRITTTFNFLDGLSFDALTAIQFMLLFYAFPSNKQGFFIVAVCVSGLTTMIKYNWDRSCGEQMGCSPLVRRTVWLVFLLLVNVIIILLCIIGLEFETDRIGWTCVIGFLLLLWTVYNLLWSFRDLDSPRFVPLYLFGSVVLVLLNSVTLMTELILKTVNGKRSVGDLRTVVFSSECLFVLILLVLLVFAPMIPKISNCVLSYQNEMRSNQTPDTRSEQNQSSQTAAGHDEPSGTRSNQKQNTEAGSHEMETLLETQNQETGRSGEERQTPSDSVV